MQRHQLAAGHRGRPRRLAKRRRGDGLAGQRLGQRRIAGPCRDGGELQRLDAQVLERIALGGQPRRLQPREEAGFGNLHRRLGMGEPLGGLARCTGAGHRVARHLDVDPGRFGQHECEAVATRHCRGLDRPAQPREHRGQRALAGRQPVLAPQGLDERVTRDRPGAMQHEEGEEQSPLAPSQSELLSHPAHGETQMPAEMDVRRPVHGPRDATGRRGPHVSRISADHPGR